MHVYINIHEQSSASNSSCPLLSVTTQVKADMSLRGWTESGVVRDGFCFLWRISALRMNGCKTKQAAEGAAHLFGLKGLVL